MLTHPSLLVVDEIGYLSINHSGAVLFFQLITRRYEHASTVLTSNKGFEEWGEVFGDDVMAEAGGVQFSSARTVQFQTGVDTHLGRKADPRSQFERVRGPASSRCASAPYATAPSARVHLCTATQW